MGLLRPAKLTLILKYERTLMDIEGAARAKQWAIADQLQKRAVRLAGKLSQNGVSLGELVGPFQSRGYLQSYRDPIFSTWIRLCLAMYWIFVPDWNNPTTSELAEVRLQALAELESLRDTPISVENWRQIARRTDLRRFIADFDRWLDHPDRGAKEPGDFFAANRPLPG